MQIFDVSGNPADLSAEMMGVAGSSEKLTYQTTRSGVPEYCNLLINNYLCSKGKKRYFVSWISSRQTVCEFCIIQSFQTACGAYPASGEGVLGVCPSVQSGRDVKVTRDLYLMSRLRMSGVISPLPHVLCRVHRDSCLLWSRICGKRDFKP